MTNEMKLKLPRRQVLLATATIGIFVTTQSTVAQVAPAELWPTQVPAPAEAGTLDVRLSALEKAAATLPAAVHPALQFEETFLRILAAVPETDWLRQIRAFTATTANDPVSLGVREVARVWLARTEMESIGTVLDQYFGENVRYPAAFSEVEKLLSADLRTDPWGDAWVYRPHAPKGFGGEARQRYQLGPKRFSSLGSLRDSIGGRQPFAVPTWKVTLQAATNNRALEFQQNGATKGVIVAGGKIDDNTLLFIGDHWALMAATDQLFTIPF